MLLAVLFSLFALCVVQGDPFIPQSFPTLTEDDAKLISGRVAIHDETADDKSRADLGSEGLSMIIERANQSFLRMKSISTEANKAALEMEELINILQMAAEKYRADQEGNVREPDPATDEPLDPSTESATGPPLNPATESATDPPLDQSTESATGPPLDPATESATDLPLDASTESATGPPLDPATELATDPPLDASTESATDPPLDSSTESATDPPLDASTESATDPPLDQSTESATDPPLDQSTESATDPPIDPATESATDPPLDPATESPTDPPLDSSTESATDPPLDQSSESPTEDEFRTAPTQEKPTTRADGPTDTMLTLPVRRSDDELPADCVYNFPTEQIPGNPKSTCAAWLMDNYHKHKRGWRSCHKVDSPEIVKAFTGTTAAKCSGYTEKCEEKGSNRACCEMVLCQIFRATAFYKERKDDGGQEEVEPTKEDLLPDNLTPISATTAEEAPISLAASACQDKPHQNLDNPCVVWMFRFYHSTKPGQNWKQCSSFDYSKHSKKGCAKLKKQCQKAEKKRDNAAANELCCASVHCYGRKRHFLRMTG